MSGLSADLKVLDRQQLFADFTSALKEGDANQAAEKMEDYFGKVEERVNNAFADVVRTADKATLEARGQRTLTSDEKNFYQTMIGALESSNYKQEITNLDLTIPETVLNEVFTDLRTSYPVIDAVDAMMYPGNVRVVYNTADRNKAVWGKITAAITEEIEADLDEKDAGAHKLSAFVYLSKSYLILGEEWLDRYVRELLYDALAYGLEDGIINGNGLDQPVGMTRDITSALDPSTGLTAKTPVALNSFGIEDLGAIFADLAKTDNGNDRAVNGVTMIVNPGDYFTKIAPAAKMLGGNGYVDVLPYAVNFVQSVCVPANTAIIGLPDRYMLTLATSKEGQIEFSDHYKFLEDDRTYIVKLLGNGFPKDNTSFQVLDISNLKPHVLPVEVVNIEDTPVA